MLLFKTKHNLVTILVGIGIFVLMCGLIICYFNYQYRQTVAAERQQLVTAAEYLDMYFDTKLAGLKVIAACPNVRSLDVDLLRGDLMAGAAVLGVANLALFDTKGNLIGDYYSISPYGPSATGDPKMVETFATVLEGQVDISGRIVHQSLENAYINIRVPVMSGDKVIAVLVAYVPITDIAKAMFHGTISNSQYIFILDDHGQLIYHPRLSELYPEDPGLKAQLSGLVFNLAGVTTYNSVEDGIDKLLIHTSLHTVNWQVATAIPLQALYARVLHNSLEDAKNFLFLLICCGLLCSIWYQARRHKLEREQLRLERMECVNQMAAGIAHEIRNPLTSIKGFIQLMARRTDKPPTPEHLELVLSEIGRIDNLINEFQMLARPLKDPVFETINMSKLLKDVVLLMEAQLHSKNINIQVKLPHIPPLVYGDMAQLKQVFINLLKNSIEAVQDGGTIVLAAGRQQDMLVVTVEDNGEGIPAEIIEKLGTPFFTTKANGSGLGLSVCYRIIHSHGGNIKVSSQRGKRTTFTVYLPAITHEPETAELLCT